jgi:hypothetical protein
MTRMAAHPPQGPVPPPGTPPGPYDVPDPTPPQNPPRRDAREPSGPTNLKPSAMYPGMKSWCPEEQCSRKTSGTPVRAIISHR